MVRTPVQLNVQCQWLLRILNYGQNWMWGEEDRPAILPKTKGSGIMVSDFVEEHGDFLTSLMLSLNKRREATLRSPKVLENFLGIVLRRRGIGQGRDL